MDATVRNRLRLLVLSITLAGLALALAFGSLAATPAPARASTGAIAAEECGYSACHGGDPIPGTETSPTVPVAVTLSVPSVPARPRARKTFSVSGMISASHYEASEIKLELARKSGKRWVARRTVTVAVAPGATSYTAKVRLPAKGTWRIRAMHADQEHLASASNYRTFRVR